VPAAREVFPKLLSSVFFEIQLTSDRIRNKARYLIISTAESELFVGITGVIERVILMATANLSACICTNDAVLKTFDPKFTTAEGAAAGRVAGSIIIISTDHVIKTLRGPIGLVP
jgi:hypothetical protein